MSQLTGVAEFNFPNWWFKMKFYSTIYKDDRGDLSIKILSNNEVCDYRLKMFTNKNGDIEYISYNYYSTINDVMYDHYLTFYINKRPEDLSMTDDFECEVSSTNQIERGILRFHKGKKLLNCCLFDIMY